MVTLKRIDEAQLDLFGWENPNQKKNENPEPLIPSDPNTKSKTKAASTKKKVVKRSLPIKNYKIVDTWSTTEPETVCDNCGKPISNIAQITSNDGDSYYVGMDCAATLSGITNSDIEYWNNAFKQAKAIRAKLRKFLKDGGVWKPFIPWYRPNSIISLLKYDKSATGKLVPYHCTCWASTPYVCIEKGNHFNSLQDIAKYSPDIARNTLISSTPQSAYLDRHNEVDRNSIPNSGSTFKGFKLEYKPATEEDLSYYVNIYKGGELWLGVKGHTHSNLSMYSKINKGQRMDIDEANEDHKESIKWDVIELLNVCLWYENITTIDQYLNTH